MNGSGYLQVQAVQDTSLLSLNSSCELQSFSPWYLRAAIDGSLIFDNDNVFLGAKSTLSTFYMPFRMLANVTLGEKTVGWRLLMNVHCKCLRKQQRTLAAGPVGLTLSHLFIYLFILLCESFCSRPCSLSFFFGTRNHFCSQTAPTPTYINCNLIISSLCW